MFDPEFICHCFDGSVSWAGHYIESYANKYDSKLHGDDFDAYFNGLFEDQPKGDDGDVIAMLSQLFGVIQR